MLEELVRPKSECLFLASDIVTSRFLHCDIVFLPELIQDRISQSEAEGLDTSQEGG